MPEPIVTLNEESLRSDDGYGETLTYTGFPREH